MHRHGYPARHIPDRFQMDMASRLSNYPETELHQQRNQPGSGNRYAHTLLANCNAFSPYRFFALRTNLGKAFFQKTSAMQFYGLPNHTHSLSLIISECHHPFQSGNRNRISLIRIIMRQNAFE